MSPNHVYLLRLWRADDTHWLASLQDSTTQVRLGFACLEDLFAFLVKQIEMTPAPGVISAMDPSDAPAPPDAYGFDSQ